jgi:hypothetical protein
VRQPSGELRRSGGGWARSTYAQITAPVWRKRQHAGVSVLGNAGTAAANLPGAIERKYL